MSIRIVHSTGCNPIAEPSHSPVASVAIAANSTHLALCVSRTDQGHRTVQNRVTNLAESTEFNHFLPFDCIVFFNRNILSPYC